MKKHFEVTVLAAALISFLYCLDAHAQYRVNNPPYKGSVEKVGVVWRVPRVSYFYDQRSIVKTFVMKDKLSKRVVDFAEPRSYYLGTGRRDIRSKATNPPVKVLHMKGGGKPVRWKIGQLPVGTYMFRIIGAIPAKDQVVPPKHLVINFKINDRLNESMSSYVLRGRGVDSFHCVQEFGFHVDDDRIFKAEVQLLGDSETSLYCYNFEIHDILATCAKRLGKKAPSHFTMAERAKARAEFAKSKDQRAVELRNKIAKESRNFTPEQREKRDDNLWHSILGRNVHFSENYWPTKGGPNSHVIKQDDMFSRQAGKKSWHLDRSYGGTYGSHWDERLKLTHDTWKGCRRNTSQASGSYSLEDFWQHKPLGDTGDRGWGVRKGNRLICPLSRLCQTALQSLLRQLNPKEADRYHLGADEAWARDAAFLLVRYAYDLPIISPYHARGHVTARAELPWINNRFYGWTIVNNSFARTYDKLYPFIKGNQELATAVGRYIRWIKTPDDVLKLLDMHLVQYMAKNSVEGRIFNDNNSAEMLMGLVVAQGNPAISEPWLEHMWTTGVYFYPIGRQPLPHVLSINTGRDGASMIGSHFYTFKGGPAFAAAQSLDKYMRQGGLSKYDLSDFNRYPEAIAGCYWPLEAGPAGLNHLNVGDVGGPSTRYARIGRPASNADEGWRWTKDPKFAWLLANIHGRQGQSHEEWSEITTAAATVKNPILGKRSRVLADWSGILESGVDHPDFRFHAAAAIRVGWGYGHKHNDALDLRVWAHGLTMSGDYGQRGSYGKPTHSNTLCHNLVHVVGQQHWGHSWVKTLSDLPGMQYLQARADLQSKLNRQTALIDVDSGRSATGASPKDSPNVETPNSYIFDVCRTQGGSMHSFNFHGCVDDMGFDINIPASSRTLFPRDDDAKRDALERTNQEAQYLSDFRWTRKGYMGDAFRPADADWAATCSANTLVATWRLGRKAEERMLKGERGYGGAVTAPRKFTRLHLFNTKGLRTLHGIVIDKQDSAKINPEYPHYAGRQIMVQKKGGKSVFVSLIEPYAGESFIKNARALEVSPASADDVSRPIAVEATVRTRHYKDKQRSTSERKDILFADASGKECQIPAHGITVAAESAAIMYSNGKVTAAYLTNGRKLSAQGIEITPATSKYTATITQINYLKREVTLSKTIPAKILKGAFVEIGDQKRSTSYEVADAFVRNGKTVLKIRKSLEYKRTRLREIKGNRVHVGIMQFADRGLFVVNKDYSKVWRVTSAGENQRFNLDRTAAMSDFPDNGIITVEIGVGQTVALPGRIALKRNVKGTFDIKANVRFRYKLNGTWRTHDPLR